MRTAYRCEKQPTGGLNRDSLINHINEEGINAPEKEENVPFELGKKRGKGRLQNNLNVRRNTVRCTVKRV